ncbi:MAG: TRAP transporter substrate-binding protein DctP [Natronospirillum sp.]
MRLVMLSRILTLTVLAVCAAPTLSEPWIMATPYGDEVHHTRNIRQFAQDLENLTDGAIQIEVRSGATLYEHGSIPRAVRTGRVALGEVLMATLAQSDPIYDLDNLPFLASNFSAAEQLWRTSRAIISNSLDHRDGMILLYAVPWPPQGLYTQHVIDQPSDLNQLRLRTYSPTTARMAEFMGAQPVNVEAAELQAAFLDGRVDSMITSPTTGISTQAWQFANHYYDVQAWIPKNMVMMNKRLYLDLPLAHREALHIAAAQAEARGWQMAVDDTQTDIQRLRTEGIVVHTPNPALNAQLQATGMVMAAEWISTSGASVESTLNAYLSAYHEAPRTNDLPAAEQFQPTPQGTVEDRATGLEWARCSLGQTWRNDTCEGRAQRSNYEGAVESITALNQGAGYAGHHDWRLPTADELHSLVYCPAGEPSFQKAMNTICQNGPATVVIDSTAFPETPPSWYWTSSVNPDDSREMIGLYFRIGYLHPLGKYGYRHYTRLVR